MAVRFPFRFVILENKTEENNVYMKLYIFSGLMAARAPSVTTVARAASSERRPLSLPSAMAVVPEGDRHDEGGAEKEMKQEEEEEEKEARELCDRAVDIITRANSATDAGASAADADAAADLDCSPAALADIARRILHARHEGIFDPKDGHDGTARTAQWGRLCARLRKSRRRLVSLGMRGAGAGDALLLWEVSVDVALRSRELGEYMSSASALLRMYSAPEYERCDRARWGEIGGGVLVYFSCMPRLTSLDRTMLLKQLPAWMVANTVCPVGRTASGRAAAVPVPAGMSGALDDFRSAWRVARILASPEQSGPTSMREWSTGRPAPPRHLVRLLEAAGTDAIARLRRTALASCRRAYRQLSAEALARFLGLMPTGTSGSSLLDGGGSGTAAARLLAALEESPAAEGPRAQLQDALDAFEGSGDWHGDRVLGITTLTFVT